jgi:hypothetical protein
MHEMLYAAIALLFGGVAAFRIGPVYFPQTPKVWRVGAVMAVTGFLAMIAILILDRP